MTIVDKFKSLTNYDVSPFLVDAQDFLSGDYNLIFSYFRGETKDITTNPFTRFTTLKNQLNFILDSFQKVSVQMNQSYWWDFLETLETIDDKFDTLGKAYKWTRSSATSFAYTPNFTAPYQLRQNQTLEDVSLTVLGDNNFQDDWNDIAFQNALQETDYTVAGGTNLNLTYPQTLRSDLKVDTVVDSMIGKSILGKDISADFQFNNSDLYVLGYDDTVMQSVNILIGIRKGDSQDFPTIGLQTSATIGGNRALLNFPLINRQLQEIFDTDDTLKGFQVTDLSIDQDNLSCSFQVTTRLNELQAQTKIL